MSPIPITGQISSFVRFPDGRHVVGARDCGIYLLSRGRTVEKVLAAHFDWITQVVVSKSIIATSCLSGCINLWNIDDLTPKPDDSQYLTQKSFRTRKITPVKIREIAAVHTMVFSPDSDTLAVGLCPLNGRGDIVLHSMDDLSEVELSGHKMGIDALTFLSDTSLASGSEDKTVRIWKKKAEVWSESTLIELEHPVSALANRGNALFIGLKNGLVMQWDIAHGGSKFSMQFKGMISTIVCFSLSERIVVASRGKGLYTVNLRNKAVSLLTDIAKDISTVVFNPDETRAYVNRGSEVVSIVIPEN